MPNATLLVVIRPVQNSNNDQTSSNQLHTSYTDARNWMVLINFIEANCSPEKQHYLSAIYKCTMIKEE